MKTIPLTRGQVAIIDDEDFERANQNKWSANRSPNDNTWYAHKTVWVRGQKPTHISLHRFIMNAPKGTRVDHRDGNGLNNLRSNLRLCTHAQNLMNMRIHNKHGLKGIAFIKKYPPHRQWIAKIKTSQGLKTIGTFPTAIEAAVAYNAMAIKHFGEFARLNPV